MKRWFPFLLPAVLALACLGGGTGTETPEPAAATDTPEGAVPPEAASPTPLDAAATAPTDTPLPAIETAEPGGSAQQTCESLPQGAVSTFLYGLAISIIVGEQEPDGVYCRFETIDVEGTAGDLGRSRAVTTLKLWDSFAACQAAGSDLASEMEDPPAPWTYVRVVPIPTDPSRILSVTAFDGETCLTAAAADVSSQPLETWLAFLGALAAER